jgi:hypothetical protein
VPLSAVCARLNGVLPVNPPKQENDELVIHEACTFTTGPSIGMEKKSRLATGNIPGMSPVIEVRGIRLSRGASGLDKSHEDI